MTKYKNKHILTISKKCIYFLKVGDNMLYDYLVNNYEKGEPIFLMDIVIKGMTEENIRYHLKKMTDEGIIDRFDSGIYYIPRINIFGENLLFLLRQLRFINMFIVGERELVFIQATLLQTGLGYQLKYQLRRRLLVITHLHRLEKLALKIKNI